MPCRTKLALLAIVMASSAAWAVPAPAVAARAHDSRLLLDVTRAGPHWVAVGEWGAVRISADAGRHWSDVASPTEETLTAVQFVDATRGVAVGHHGTVIVTLDGGQSWTRRNPDASSKEPLLGVYFENPEHGFVVGTFGALLESQDGARTFRPRDIGQGDHHLKAIVGTPAGGVYIASEEGGVYCSADHGRTFRTTTTGYRGSFWGVSVVDQAVLVYGMRGTIYRSDDACRSWVAVPSGTTAGLITAAVPAPGRVVLAGADGALLESADGGRSFVVVPRSDRAGITAAAAVSANEVLLLGRAEPSIHRLVKP